LQQTGKFFFFVLALALVYVVIQIAQVELHSSKKKKRNTYFELYGTDVARLEPFRLLQAALSC
jgi:hypothetical protein